MKKTNYEEAVKIINHSSWLSAGIAFGVGLVPGVSLLIDVPALGLVNINMIVSLGELFGQNIARKVAAGLLSEITAVVMGVSAAAIVASFFPGVASITNSLVAYGVTQIIGRCVYIIFSQNRNLEDIGKENKSFNDSDGGDFTTWTDRKKWLEKVLYLSMQRLRILEEKAAMFGFDCPPHITTEIDKIKREIEIIKQDIKE